VMGGQFDTAKLDLPLRSAGRPTSRAVAQTEILTELGELSLAIGDAARARRYLERAVERDPGGVHALAALGDALAAQRDWDGAEQRYRAALAAAPDDALLHLGEAHLLVARARETADDARRAELAREAREHYARSAALAGAVPEADAGLAATYLLAGEDPAQGRAPLRRARSALPGDAELARLDARLAISGGDPEAARRIAIQLVARARSAPELEAARSLLDQIDLRAAIR